MMTISSSKFPDPTREVGVIVQFDDKDFSQQELKNKTKDLADYFFNQNISMDEALIVTAYFGTVVKHMMKKAGVI